MVPRPASTTAGASASGTGDVYVRGVRLRGRIRLPLASQERAQRSAGDPPVSAAELVAVERARDQPPPHRRACTARLGGNVVNGQVPLGRRLVRDVGAVEQREQVGPGERHGRAVRGQRGRDRPEAGYERAHRALPAPRADALSSNGATACPHCAKNCPDRPRQGPAPAPVVATPRPRGSRGWNRFRTDVRVPPGGRCRYRCLVSHYAISLSNCLSAWTIDSAADVPPSLPGLNARAASVPPPRRPAGRREPPGLPSPAPACTARSCIAA